MQYQTHYSSVFHLHFYPCLSTSFAGSNYNTCFYAIKSHDQNYYTYITTCISINVMEMLELITYNH